MRNLQQESRAFALAWYPVLLLGLSSGCATTPVVTEFSLNPEARGFEIVPGMPALNTSPIYVWLYTNPDGSIVRVRATGHATESICAVASKALFDLRGRPSADGLMSFGIADMVAKRGSEAEFSRDAGATAEVLTSLSKKNPDFVVVRSLPLPLNLDELHAGVPSLDGDLERNVFLGVRSVGTGPALVPLRKFDGSGVSALSFTISRDDLAMPEADFERLAGDIQLAPMIDYRDRTARLIETIDDTVRLKRDASLFNDGKWAYYLRAESMSSLTIDDKPAMLGYVNQSMGDCLRKYEALGALLRIGALNSPEQDLHMRKATAELERARTINYQCALALLEGKGCETVNFDRQSGQWVFFDFASKAADKGMLQLVKEVREIPDETLEKARREATNSLVRANELIEQARIREVDNTSHYGAFTLIDGMLRGWPIPTSDQQDALKIDGYLAHQLPKVWKLAKERLAEQGVSVEESGSVAGVLSRANVLYRVTAEADHYRVQPLYEVTGKYAEVWNKQTQLVTIETPYDNIN